ncbi:glycosyltransferase family 9 protein [Cetobacterium sp. 2A]|uniref:glycosyltransferase family 9 protein n=1 Tax=Cetobacterium sp. 2A TaxID=2754723 RepID=UPI00163B9D9E|nr:glycosyltransferase family 9 protein [Cetobacterium sp. 2A]MBC2856270.1 glycosyltransferase family 9 protein [Cetobacterium sp. 2A]
MRILVIRLSSIGDVILTTPVLKEFKEKYPDSIIDFLVLDKFKDAIEGSPYVDNVILFKKGENDGISNIVKFGKKLKENGYDYIFDLHAKARSIIISGAIGVKTYRYKKRSWEKTILVKLKLSKYEVDNTIVKNYFGAFEDFGLEYKGEDLNFPYSESDKDKVKEYVGHPVLAPGASKETKKWTPEGFGKLAKIIFEKYGVAPIIIGSKDERAICEKIREISGNVAINLAGELSLKESGALLSQSKFLVTNDSGPFHIARGVKCKAYVIFGPTSPWMFDYDENSILIYRKESCSPCSLHGDKECPKGHFNCMKLLTPETVMQYIEKS